jgi:ABC-2 type transport system ATP-binding protein
VEVTRDGDDVLLVEDVSCRFGSRLALDSVSLAVPALRVVGLLGPNGAGKTTLISLVAGLRRPSQGSVRVLGQSAAEGGRKLRRRIGVVPQETGLYEELSALQNLRFSASLYGVEDVEGAVRSVLETVDLWDRRNDTVAGFSGGMQRRLAIARALVHDPELLILDEPTLGIDAEARHSIWGHVRDLRTRGKTVLISTNYLDEAEALCDEAVVLRQGQVVAVDTPAGLITRAGRCVELDCPEAHMPALTNLIAPMSSVRDFKTVDGGMWVYLHAHGRPEDVVTAAIGSVPLTGFRHRAPDMIEVFNAVAAVAS